MWENLGLLGHLNMNVCEVSEAKDGFLRHEELDEILILKHVRSPGGFSDCSVSLHSSKHIQMHLVSFQAHPATSAPQEVIGENTSHASRFFYSQAVQSLLTLLSKLQKVPDATRLKIFGGGEVNTKRTSNRLS